MTDAPKPARTWRVPLEVLNWYEMPRDPEFVDVVEASALEAAERKCDELRRQAEALAGAIEWYVENAEATFFELAGGDGAPVGHFPTQGNWDKANEALAAFRAFINSKGDGT